MKAALIVFLKASLVVPVMLFAKPHAGASSAPEPATYRVERSGSGYRHVLVLSLPGGSPKEFYAATAREVCVGENPCVISFWTDQASLPSSSLPSGQQLKAMAAQVVWTGTKGEATIGRKATFALKRPPTDVPPPAPPPLPKPLPQPQTPPPPPPLDCSAKVEFDRFSGFTSVSSKCPSELAIQGLVVPCLYAEIRPTEAIYHLTFFRSGDDWRYLRCSQAYVLADGMRVPVGPGEHSGQAAGMGVVETVRVSLAAAALEMLGQAEMIEFKVCQDEFRTANFECAAREFWRAVKDTLKKNSAP